MFTLFDVWKASSFEADRFQSLLDTAVMSRRRGLRNDTNRSPLLMFGMALDALFRYVFRVSAVAENV